MSTSGSRSLKSGHANCREGSADAAPFDGKHGAWLCALRRCAHGLDPPPCVPHQRLSPTLNSCRLTHDGDATEDLINRVRVQRQDTRFPVHRLCSLRSKRRGNGADLADRLAEHEIRGEPAELRMIQGVDAAVPLARIPQGRVDLGTRSASRLEPGAAQAGSVQGFGGVIALVGYPDHGFPKSQSEGDFGPAGQ